MRKRAISNEGIKLFNISFSDLKDKKKHIRQNKPFIKKILFDLFSSDYDLNLKDTVEKLRINCYKLYSELDYKQTKKISKLIDNAITNIILSILTFNSEIATYRQAQNNYYYYLDIGKKAFKEKDHNTALIIRAAVNTTCLKRLRFKLRKTDKKLFDNFEETYGSFLGSCSKHVTDVMDHLDKNISVIPSIMILIIHLNKAKEYSKSFKNLGSADKTYDFKKIKLIKILNNLKKRYSNYKDCELLDLYLEDPNSNSILKVSESNSMSTKLFDICKHIPSPRKSSCFYKY